MGNHHFALSECERRKEFGCCPDGPARDVCNRLPGNLDGEAFGPEPGPMTCLTGFQQCQVLVVRGVRRHGIPDAVAGWTGPVRTIKGEDARRDLWITDAAPDARELFTVQEGLPLLC